ncbi:hypothetical protein JCM33374_g1616 [Metschnikowia sp. JCM 33374]|nr:hypothetical protein JCM33374_g1616 [Metschnikowia sp. JCM 33374]
MKKKHRIHHLTSQAAELEDYENVISDLDSKLEGVQKRIQELKACNSTSKLSRSPDGEPSEPRSVISKELKYKKIQQKMLADQESLAHKFLQSRASIAAVASTPEIIANLFASSPLPTSSGSTENLPTATETDTSKENYEINPKTRTFSSPIQNSLMSLSHSIISTSLIELNIRYALFDKKLTTHFPGTDSLYRSKLFQNMSDDKDKQELLSNMSDFCIVPSSNSKSFLKSLHPKKKEMLFASFRRSDHFADKESQRYDMYIHKSGRWRNYEDSDTAKQISAIRGPVFESNTVSNVHYFEKFQTLFSSYKSERRPLKHINLVLEIARILASDGKFIPSNAIFRDLLDKFGEVGLTNYQHLVYDSLPDFQHRKTAWADGVASHSFAEKKLIHFQSLIEEDPQLLGSLIEYNTKRGNASFVKKLFAYLEPVHNAYPQSQTILPHFMTKRFDSSSRGSNEALEKPILFENNIIELAIKACVDLEEYKSIDKLLNKLVFNSIDTPSGLKIFSGSHFGSDKLLLNNFSTDEVVNKLFNENILCMLGQVYVSSKDLRRCEWIAPIIQKYITKTDSPKLSTLYKSIVHLLESIQSKNQKDSQVRHHDMHGKSGYSITKIKKTTAFEETSNHTQMASFTT